MKEKLLTSKWDVTQLIEPCHLHRSRAKIDNRSLDHKVLRRETTITLKWVAKRLKMGAATHLSNCLVQKRKQNEGCQ